MSSEERAPLIKTPGQLVAVGALAFVIPVFAAVMTATWVVTSSKAPSAGGAAEEEVAKRIRPVADLAIADAGGAGGTASGAGRSGESIYKATCSVCQASGVANAPKFGDKAAWAKLIAEGQKRLVADSMKGIRGMPPRGGAMDLSDVEFERAVVYMANAAGGSFKEPAAAKPAGKKK